MIELESVLGAFALLADLSAEEANNLSIYASMAIGEVCLMLREGVITPANEERLCHACAAGAYYKYALVSATKALHFKAGDITMSAPDAKLMALARRVYDDALGGIADLIDSDGFAFQQVAP